VDVPASRSTSRLVVKIVDCETSGFERELRIEHVPSVGRLQGERCLAENAVVILDPKPYRIVWPQRLESQFSRRPHRIILRLATKPIGP
jgi:hypothetical protein